MVVRILGRPTGEVGSSAGQENYPWGFVAYDNGRLTMIDYEFKTRASSTEDALKKVGLEQTSKPFHGPLSYRWNSDTGPLVCCGFEMDNVVIMSNLSGIMVGFKRTLPTDSPAEKARHELVVNARIRFAALLGATYKSEARLIWVEATGYDHETLQLSSVLMAEGTDTRGAAERETIACAECIAAMKKLGFKRIMLTDQATNNTWIYPLE